MIKHKFFRTFLFLILITSSVSAQILQPVNWTVEQKKLSGDEVLLIFKAKIDNSWYLYDLDIPQNGPVPTSFTFEPSASYTLVEATNSITEPEIKKDAAFNMELRVYFNEAVFQTRIKINKYPARITGYATYMSCDGTRCTPPMEEEFEFLMDKAVSRKGRN
jgi:hypothetical protein